MALVDPAGLVVGLLDWDTAKTFTPPVGHVLRASESARVGDVWTGQTFTAAGVEADNRAALIAKIRAYLALPSPTQAQTTKAMRALVLLAINALSDISRT